MKKLIVPGYFILMLLITFVAVRAAGSLRMKDVETSYYKLDHRLSDTEIDEYNATKQYQKVLEHRDGYKQVRYDEVRETRTKQFLGWSVKRDTLSSYVLEEKCNCGN